MLVRVKLRTHFAELQSVKISEVKIILGFLLVDFFRLKPVIIFFFYAISRHMLYNPILNEKLMWIIDNFGQVHLYLLKKRQSIVFYVATVIFYVKTF